MSVHPFTGARVKTRADGSPYDFTLVPATVYTFFDGEGRALYVGCTTRGYTRFDGHAKKDWWTEVARIETEHFEDKSDGFVRERLLIRELRPPHNLLWNPDRKQQLEQTRAHFRHRMRRAARAAA